MPSPALFVSPGAPGAALEDLPWTRAPGARARERPRPGAIAVGSVPATGPVDLLFFVLGRRGPRDRRERVCRGVRHGSLSPRSFALATP